MKGSSRLRQRTGGPVPTREHATPVVLRAMQVAAAPAPAPTHKRVLFVCIGNSCRSQMAEGFAKVFGNDCIRAYSAGTNPAPIVQDETFFTMRKRGIQLQDQFPKGIELLIRQPFDVVVNMSGMMLPRMNATRVLEWKVRDPIGRSEQVYQDVADQIENLVRGLITELRG